jgi:hypothetical protein
MKSHAWNAKFTSPSCRGKPLHAPDECDCFTPDDFVDLLALEGARFELIMRLNRCRYERPEGIETPLIRLLLDDLARLLRN